MSQQLVKAEPQGIAADRIQVIKDTFAKGATDEELRLFIAVAESRGLDPRSRAR